MSRLLWLLIQRAQTVGVADHTNIGLCVSALHQLKLLNIESTSLLETIHAVINQASTRSKVNVLECLIRNINIDKHFTNNVTDSSNISRNTINTIDRVNDKRHERYQVKDNLPDLFHRVLREIQLDLMQNDAIDELGVADTVLFTETLLQLMALRCTSDVNNNLLRTLQDRLLAFVNVVKSPLEWMSIVRIAVEVYRLPVHVEYSAINIQKGENVNNSNNTISPSSLATSSMSSSREKIIGRVSVDEETHRWSDELLTRILTNITPHLSTFTKRELMQLFDTITLRRSTTFDFNSLTSFSANTHESKNTNDDDNNCVALQTQESNWTNVVTKYKLSSSDTLLSRNENVYENIPDNCRVLIKSILDLIMSEHLEQLTPAQSTAWLHRLVSCKLDCTHGLFERITSGMLSRELYKNMSREQLSSAICSLGRALLNENTFTFDKEKQSELADVGSIVKKSVDITVTKDIITSVQIDNRLTLYTLLLKQLVVKLQEQHSQRDSFEAESNTVRSLLPIFSTLPERAWNAYAERKCKEENCIVAQSSKAGVVHCVPHNNTQESQTKDVIKNSNCSSNKTSKTIDDSHCGESENSSESVSEKVEQLPKIVLTFAESLRQACSLMLHYFPHLLPRDQMLVVVVAIRWHVFDLHKQEFHNNSYYEYNHSAHVQALMTRAQVLTENEATRKMNALCGLVHGALTHYIVFQLISVLYEIANAMANAWVKDPRFVSSQLTILRQYQPDEYLSWPLFDQSNVTESETHDDYYNNNNNTTNNLVSESKSVNEKYNQNNSYYYLFQSTEKTTFRLCHVIHRLIQANYVDKLESISTWHLLRYMSAMSKIHVRTRNEYHIILHVITTPERLSTLLPEQLVMLINCMSLQRVSNIRVIHRLIYVIEHYSHAMSTLHKVQLLISWAALCQTPPCTAPAWAPLEARNYFQSKTEIDALPLSVQLDLFYALMELQQYENKTLHWIANSVFDEQVTRANGVATIKDVHVIDTVALLNKLSTIPFITLMRTATALCRWGNDFIDISILSLVLHALTRELSRMQNIFDSLTSWGVYWHLFTEYEHLYESNQDRCKESNTSNSNRSNDKKSRVDDAVRIFTDAANVFIMVRITSIAQDVSLRPNTFLFRQLALAIQLNAMPAEGSDDEKQLINNLDLARLPQMRGNLPQTVSACVVVCHVCLRYPETSLKILHFIKEYLMLMRVQEKLAIWYYCNTTINKINNYLDGANHLPNTDSRELRRSSNNSKSNHERAIMTTNKSLIDVQLRKIQELLFAIILDVKECLVKPENVARLSPTEKRLKDKLLAM